VDGSGRERQPVEAGETPLVKPSGTLETLGTTRILDMIQELAEKIAGLLGLNFGLWGLGLVLVLRVLIVGVFYLGGISAMAMFSIWWERKIAGHIQSRLGPMHVGLWHGWAQSIADGVKLMLKEDLLPEGADGFLFRLAPYLAFAPVFAAFMALPFGPQFIFEGGLNIGVLYLLAVLAVEVMGVILAGWASHSKWSIYGAMREACQMVSYEVPLGIAILCGVLVAGTLDLLELGYLQGGGVQHWVVFHNPFVFMAFLVYFIASLASNKRAPFDLPESESELVAGFHTEYSGLRFSFFFFAEYASMFVVGAIQAALFLGAWNSPLGSWDPVYRYVIHYHPALAAQAYFNGAVGAAHGWGAAARAMGLPGAWQLWVLNLYSLAWFCGKVMAMIFVQMWLRWTLPRIRIDQVLHTCVKVLLPASLVTFLGTAVWLWLVPQSAGVAVGVGGQERMIAALGSLTVGTPMLQLGVQVALAILGVGLVLACAAVVAAAYLRRDTQPRQSLVTDVMPVGRAVAFTTGGARGTGKNGS
jgi:NADH-quinone oxidoreductase subunit H